MLEPLRQKRRKTQVSAIKAFGPPVGGWASLGSTYEAGNTAQRLQNLIPLRRSIKARNGCATLADGAGGIRSLMPFERSSDRILLAADDSKVYTVPSYNGGLPIKSPLVELQDGFTQGSWDHVMMSNAANVERLVCVNGADGVWTFDGTDFTQHAFSSENHLNYDSVTVHKARLWMTRQTGLNLYYGLEAAGNEPTEMVKFPVGPFLAKGGNLIAVDTISLDGGSGPDDLLVAVSDVGQVIVYAGLDPNVDFRMVGVFNLPEPVGKRCLMKVGKDLVYYSKEGPSFLSNLFPAASTNTQLTAAVQDEWNDFYVDRSDSDLWNMELYTSKGWALFNVPMANGQIHQYTFSMKSGAWFEITGWNGNVFAVMDSVLYFGDAAGNVKVADYGENDDGQAIDVDYAMSWDEFDSPSTKKYGMVQMTVRTNSSVNLVANMMVDRILEDPTNTPGFAPPPELSLWNVAQWDQAPWSGADKFYIATLGLSKQGYVGALRYKARLLDVTHEFYGCKVSYEEGDFL